jgi:hypothetical protein
MIANIQQTSYNLGTLFGLALIASFVCFSVYAIAKAFKTRSRSWVVIAIMCAIPGFVFGFGLIKLVLFMLNGES